MKLGIGVCGISLVRLDDFIYVVRTGGLWPFAYSVELT